MILPAGLPEFLSQHGWGDLREVTPVGGGCINHAARLATQRGPAALLKFNPEAPPDMFTRESEGLAALADAPGAPRVPKVLGVGSDWILLEYLDSAHRQDDFDRVFAIQLAAMHEVTSDSFGFERDNYIGSTPQVNTWTKDGHQFFAERRLLPQVRLAQGRGLLGQAEVQSVDALCRRLKEIVPDQPASLIHGDLWAGNLMSGPRGEPVLIDPATHFGWGEAELGMMRLFGGFAERVFETYAERRALAPGWRDRLDLYNLYHLLNHLNLFGPGYLDQVRHTLARYGVAPR
jgi:fructosamine-3-kinase